mgnify:CR=1 FL=1
MALTGNGLMPMDEAAMQPQEQAPVVGEDTVMMFMDGLGALNTAVEPADYDAAISTLEQVKGQVGEMSTAEFIDTLIANNPAPEPVADDMESDEPADEYLAGYGEPRGEMSEVV